MYWNATGINNIDNISDSIEESDIVCVCETWHTCKPNNIISKHHATIDVEGVKTADKGRASGGLLIAYSGEIYKDVEVLQTHKCFIFIKVIINKTIYIIGLIYINQTTDVNEIFDVIDDHIINFNVTYRGALIIIGGDMNARIANNGELDISQVAETAIFTSKRESLDKVTNKRGKDLIRFAERNELFVANGRFPGDSTGQFTFVNTQGSSVIDMVLINYEAIYNVEDFEVINYLTKSNHFPVKVVLNINNFEKNRNRETVKWKNKEVCKYKYNMKFSQNVSKINLNVNEMSQNLIETINYTAKKLNMVKSKYRIFKNKNKPWYDNTCKELRVKLDFESRRIRKLNFPKKEVEDLHKLRNKYYRLIDLKQKQFKENKITLISQARNSKVFWELINSFRSAKSIETNSIELNRWYEFFRGIYSTSQCINKDIDLLNVQVPELDSEVMIEEIYMALRKIKTKKAPGEDGISNEFLKALPNNWVLYINILFNKIIKNEEVPESWSYIITKMLFKKGDKSLPENYRPISLVNTLAKLFTSILYNRLSEWAEMNLKLPEWQAGFRPDRSTLDHIFVLNYIIQSQLKKKGGKLYALFVDLKSAFTSVTHSILWRKLKNIGVSSKFIRILINLYKNAHMSVRTNDGVSEKCKITLGLLQGEILSPLLFSLFLSDIEEFLISKGVRGVPLNHLVEVILLAFADDMVFVSDSLVYLRKIVKYLEEYFQLNELEVNVQKTKIILFQKGGHGHKSRISPIYYRNREIEFEKQYLYLGVPVVQSGTYDVSKQYFMSKGRNAVQPTVNLINNLKYVNAVTCCKLYNGLIKSTVMYAAAVWSLRHLKELEVIQNTFFRRLFNLPQNTPGYAIRLELGVDRIEITVFKLILNFIHKILAMPDHRYPKICLKKMMSNRQDTLVKYDWFKQVKVSFFEILNKTEFLDQLTLGKIILEKNSLIESLRKHLILEDRMSCQKSSSLTILPMLSTNTNNELHHSQYLNLNIPLYQKKAIIQLRMLNVYCPRIIINGNRYDPKNFLYGYCEYCHIENNITHAIVTCSRFTELKINLFPELKDSNNISQDFLLVLNDLDITKIKNIITLISSIFNENL